MKKYKYIITAERPSIDDLEDFFNMYGKDGYKYIDSAKLSNGSLIFIMQKEEGASFNENLEAPKYDKISEGGLP